VETSGVSPCRYHSTMVIHALISPGGRKIGPLVASGIIKNERAGAKNCAMGRNV
jgi:hypothetical protein